MNTTGRFAFALFRVFGCSLLFAAVLLMPHETFADSVTQSCSSVSVDFDIFGTAPPPQTLVCGQFNAALGTLQSTTVEVDSTLGGNIGVEISQQA